MEEFLKIINKVNDRFELWYKFLNLYNLKKVAELGVYKGDFAEVILGKCNFIEKYYMIDPWRNLTDWNKPANTSDTEFDELYKETLEKTNFAKSKRIILRGKTTEVINEIEDGSLDFIYIDGDHTLKGISIDLIATWCKISENGYVAGDDFCSSIWQHSKEFEPTLIFPFAIYFAEAMNVKIFALPFNQFLICKGTKGYEFIDLTDGKYKNVNLLQQLKDDSNRKPENKMNFLSKIVGAKSNS